LILLHFIRERNTGFTQLLFEFCVCAHDSTKIPFSVIQYYKTKGTKMKITEITLKDIQKWNLNIARFRSYFNTQFFRGEA